MSIKVHNITKKFADKTVLAGASLTLKANTILALMSKSGEGKSTFLDLLAGFQIPSTGTVCCKNPIAYVAQGAELFEWLTVRDSLLLPVVIKKDPLYKVSDMQLVEFLRSVQLPDLLTQVPLQLSGGMKQRVLLIQAILSRPKVLLLDEALSEVDWVQKKKILIWLRQYCKNNEISCLYVTHDLRESLMLADELALLEAGFIRKKLVVTESDRAAAWVETPYYKKLWQISDLAV